MRIENYAGETCEVLSYQAQKLVQQTEISNLFKNPPICRNWYRRRVSCRGYFIYDKSGNYDCYPGYNNEYCTSKHRISISIKIRKIFKIRILY